MNLFKDTNFKINNLLSIIKRNSSKEEFHSIRTTLIEETPNNYRAIIALETRGCQYAAKVGACSICGHNSSILWKPDILSSNTLQQFLNSYSQIENKKISELGIYSSGSFFDEHEIETDLIIKILKKIHRDKKFNNIRLESLPHYITESKISLLNNVVGDLSISIGIGFDCFDNKFRAILTQKHIYDNKYADAIKICKRYRIKTIAYIVLKPPLIDENEAIWLGGESIRKALELGFDEISLEPIALQKNTLQKFLFDLGEYEPPNVWTIYKTIHYWNSKYNKRKQKVKFSIGGQVFTPEPDVVFANCIKCSKKVTELLNNDEIEINVSSINEKGKCCNSSHNYITKAFTIKKLNLKISNICNKLSGKKKIVLPKNLI